MIKFNKPESKNCNACAFGEAVVSLEFSSSPHANSAQAIRLCTECLLYLNTNIQQFIVDKDLLWGEI